MTTPPQLQHLATRMGLTAVLDASGGYDVVRVIVTNRDRAEVFDPENDAEQSMAVLCWMLRRDVWEQWNIVLDSSEGFIHGVAVVHCCTPESLRAAILAAALRVAGET